MSLALALPRAATPWSRLAVWLTRHLGAFGVTAVLALGGVGPLLAQCAPAPAPSAQQQVVDLTNARRAAAGLPALTVDGRLSNAAQDHSNDQAARDRMSHTGSNGSNAGQRITNAGYRWASYGENVAAGYSSATAVMDGWMGSSGHRANILGQFTNVGVGLAYAADGTPYWTMVVARPG